jgi:DNA replication protein DnaC
VVIAADHCTTDLVQRLQVTRRELALEAAINRLDRFDLVILDDLAYVSKDRPRPACLSSLSARYERRSIPISANQPFVTLAAESAGAA